MRAKLFSPAILTFFLLVSFSSYSQETIQDQFNDFYENQTSTWEQYQMVKRPNLKNFWKVVTDTINGQKKEIAVRDQKISVLNTQIDTLNSRNGKLEASLASSEAFNDQISFLGIDLNKSGYNIIVWAIIIGLAFAVASIYLMFMRSNSVTQKTQKAYSALEREFDQHKNLSRESQAKIKRELQTALNTLHENRINM